MISVSIVLPNGVVCCTAFESGVIAREFLRHEKLSDYQLWSPSGVPLPLGEILERHHAGVWFARPLCFAQGGAGNEPAATRARTQRQDRVSLMHSTEADRLSYLQAHEGST